MSYILDALRKSDQQRQQGMTPTLAMAPIQAPATASSAQRSLFPLGLLAFLLLCVGISIGWLRPWQDGQITATQRPAAPPPTSSVPVTKPEPVAQFSPAAEPSVPLPAKPEIPTKTVPKANPTASAPQPPLPAISITVHTYSSDPAERMVVINRRPLHEGEEVAPGLKLEKIAVDGVVLNYKGQRLRRGLN